MIEDGGQDCFPQLYKYVNSNKLIASHTLMSHFTDDLEKLIERFYEDDVEKCA